jgi:hypothetical protein
MADFPAKNQNGQPLTYNRDAKLPIILLLIITHNIYIYK